MGGALACVAAASAGGERVLIADHNPDKLEKISARCGAIPDSPLGVAGECRFIFLGVKPQVMAACCGEIAGTLAARREDSPFVVVTMAAGLTAQAVSAMLGNCPVIRIMPNTPCSVGEGVIPYCLGEGVTAREEKEFLALMGPAGYLVKLEEGKIDMASAVTGCGPAFVCLFIEAMTDGAVRCGLPRDKAQSFALRTVLGTARLALETGADPACLRAQVCSPAGSTIEGVAVLEERATRSAVIDAVKAAYDRTAQLGK